MKFTLDGKPVWAECSLKVAPHDDLMSDFQKNTKYDYYTNFFEVSNFSMSMSLKAKDESSNVLGSSSRLQDPHQSKGPPSSDYARWRSASEAAYKKITYPLEFGQCNFQRVIDSASPVFFKSCCMSHTFDGAVLVKRIAVGNPEDPDSLDRPSVAYLRMEFTDVLIVGISWTDGELVTEQCDFICRGLSVQYRPQFFSGKLGGFYSAKWPGDRALNILARGRV